MDSSELKLENYTDYRTDRSVERSECKRGGEL